MGQKDISVSGDHKVEKSQLSDEFFIRPAVDIFETEQGLTLVADLPGVDKEELTIDLAGQRQITDEWRFDKT